MPQERTFRHAIGHPRMGKTKDFGRRIEIHSLDKYCHDISIGLYRDVIDGRARFLVHTYHASPAAAERVAAIRESLIALADLVEVPNEPNWLQFRCGQQHLRALKRAFLDICRLPPDEPVAQRALTIFDKKCDGELRAESSGEGLYRLHASVDTEAGAKRAMALARGYAKLCEMELLSETEPSVRFSCQESHDPLVGFLMFRAQNVRAAMKEEESASGRGVLAPPSQQ